VVAGCRAAGGGRRGGRGQRGRPGPDGEPAGQTALGPAGRVEPIEGTTLNRVVLSADAADRIGVRTVPARDALVDGKPRVLIPYAALLYDPEGQTWAYTNPAPLVFVRQQVTVDAVVGEDVRLSGGLVAGTPRGGPRCR